MPGKDYYSKVYRLQDDILRLVQDARVDFYLTGGTALSRGYLNHRYSDDLDFFINQASDFKQQVERVVGKFNRSDLELARGTASASFVRMTARKDRVSVKIDFVNDIEYHYGEFESSQFFHKIDSWRNILSNKLCAISRLEPKDLADILFIANSFPFKWPEIIKEAQSKDLWVDPIEICRILSAFRIDLFDAVKWALPLEKDLFSRELNQINDDIFYGRANSLAD